MTINTGQFSRKSFHGEPTSLRNLWWKPLRFFCVNCLIFRPNSEQPDWSQGKLVITQWLLGCCDVFWGQRAGWGLWKSGTGCGMHGQTGTSYVVSCTIYCGLIVAVCFSGWSVSFICSSSSLMQVKTLDAIQHAKVPLVCKGHTKQSDWGPV